MTKTTEELRIYEHLRDSGAQTPWEARTEVLEFAAAMEGKLRKNDHKTGWKDQPIEAHIRLLKIELMEFDVALEFLGDEEAAKECVDIANFALIIRDKLKARIVERNNVKATVLTGSRPPEAGSMDDRDLIQSMVSGLTS